MKSEEKNTPALRLDPDAIDSVLRVGGVGLLARLVEVAEENVRNRLDQLAEALASDPPDLAAAERAAHSIKSSAAYLGVEILRRRAEEMEADAGEGKTAGLSVGLQEARRLLDLAIPVLEEEVRRRT